MVVNMTFLIDIGSDISIIPFTGKGNQSVSDLTLYAANNTHIATYGTKRLSINLGLRRSFAWDFCTAEVPYPIIGAECLSICVQVKYWIQPRI